MTNPLGPVAFFTLEASDCLDRLDAMFATDAPPPDELVRVARMLRGSALMANQPQLARAAAGFEALGRAYRDKVRSWDAATREQASQAIEEFRALLRRITDWQEADAARAVRLGAHLDSLAGQGPVEAERFRRSGATAAADLQTGVRAFVAREGALIASALDRAARAMRMAPDDREPLYMVLRRMQSLQGLAELPDLAPLPDVLDGIELAVGDLSRLHAAPPKVEDVLAAGALALARVSRDIAEHGVPAPDADEPRRFTELLLEAFAVERDVVPIESLYAGGEASPVERAADVPHFAPPTPPGSLELVSLGEHLVQTAGLLEGARSATELDLRLYRLIGTLRAAASPHTDPIGSALGIFGRATREWVATGTVKSSREAFAVTLRETGELLRVGGTAPDRMYLSRRILDLAHRLDESREPSGAVAEPAVEPAAQPAAEPATEPVVAIESLAPDFTALERGLTDYERLVREQGLGTASIEGLIGRKHDEPPPLPPQPSAPSDEAVVAIQDLCYRGRRALERADEVRGELRNQLARRADLIALQPLIEELLDLVPLALAESD